jgi:hypothetical protein
MLNAVLSVGGGRGFVVNHNHRNWPGGRAPIIITAAHCLPRKLPPPHPWRSPKEATYRRLLGPLGGRRTVWAECIFVDPVADIAVLGQPDNQTLPEEADAYEALVESLASLVVADAPKQRFELLTLPGLRKRQVKRPTPSEGQAFVLLLDGQWREGRVKRYGPQLAFEPKNLFVNGMSGSPILDAKGNAIGVVSCDSYSPVIVDSLSTYLVRGIRTAR